MDLRSVAALISDTPYRTDKAGEKSSITNCLHYSVATRHSGTFSDLLDKISAWIKGTSGLSKLQTRGDIEDRNLDIAVFIGQEALGHSYTMPTVFLREVDGLGLSLTLSVYKNEDGDA